MSLNKVGSFFNRLATRLFLVYGVLFTAGMIIVYLSTVYSLADGLDERINIRLSKEIRELEDRYDREGLEELKEEFVLESLSEDSEEIVLQLISAGGDILATSDLSFWEGVNLTGLSAQRPRGDLIQYSTLFDTQRNYKVRVAQKRIADNYTILIGHILEDDQVLIASYKKRFGFAVLGLVALMGFLIWVSAEQAVDGIRKVTDAAAEIEKGNLKTRVLQVNGNLEVEQLTQAFNSMSERIEVLVKEMRDVTNNIAHDLRSPLTRIRGFAETALYGKKEIETYQEMAGIVIEETDNMISMINTLLEIAETDAGLSEMNKLPVNLGELVEEACDLFSPAAKARQISLTCSVNDEGLIMSAGLQPLQRVISNLLDNALKYTPKQGAVAVNAYRKDDAFVLEVKDTGSGIPADSITKIFDPFFRLDQSRTTPGNGLGLSYVRSVADSLKGQICVDSTPGTGTTILIKFPQSIF